MGDNRWLSEMLGKFDEKVLKAKINKALEIVKNGSDEEIKKAIDKIDKDEAIKKIESIDKKTLQSTNLNVDELKKKVTDKDFERVSKIVGKEGEEILLKIKELLK